MAIDIEQIEHTIGYTFKNKNLLQQAFVRRSYSEEYGGQNNEVLEFIGDKALDLAVVRLMMLRFGEITEDKEWSEFKLISPKYFKTKLGEGKFTDIKKLLVQKKTLSKCIDRLGFHKQLIMGKGDIEQGVENQDSVKEDLFEAIIGAIALDCDFNMRNISYVVDAMLDVLAFFKNEDFNANYDGNYVSWLQEWTQSQGYGLPNYTYTLNTDDNSFTCRLTITGKDGFKHFELGDGFSHAKARAVVAYKTFIYLREQGIIKNRFEDAVGKPYFEESIRQLNELYQKRLIAKPEYSFNEEHDENGDSIWFCTLTVEGFEKKVEEGSNSKKDAQRFAAYNFLCYIMGIEEELEGN